MNPAHYSYSWAATVVGKLEQKYPRATDILYKMFEITSRDMANYLASGDPIFPALRVIVHEIDIYDQIHNPRANYYSLVEYFTARWEFIYSGNESERLVTRLNLIRMKEQGSWGAGGESVSDRLQLPLNFP